ncbi:ABC transporter ATP-binding protein [Albibacterium bauzanense]|uniref:ATP-binding cassette subfamily B protein n=1 Tax=Albibacterium bauzanense TaxID=653929 RepID=A0A4R1M7D9_9SPHI|nr:ABC transporter ATP-binding protein [Albibacterium bauzanense]TCK85613.1 ATP-binding cassette subfamily B protein [Albibacterium bauzanense]
MKYLLFLNKYFYKYRWRLIPGVLFVIASNYFGILPAQVIRIAFDLVKENISLYQLFDGFDRQKEIYQIFGYSLLLFGTLVLILAIIRGLFLFLMRQTIILTSRHIEYDLKNEIYGHYQKLDMAFFRKNNTGDLLNRVTEDVGRVRGYLGPALMYSINTIVLTIMVVVAMLNVNTTLTFYALLPIPFLATVILLINKIINQRSERIQQQLSSLSNFVQETFSGIRVLKSYNREEKKMKDFRKEGDLYKDASISLVKAQAIFFPLILMLVGLSTILTVYIGGQEVIKGNISSGNIAEFIVYVSQLTFPAMSLAWVNSLIQRAAASQKRINEFLETKPDIHNTNGSSNKINGHIKFDNVSFTYPHTGIEALKNISFDVDPGETLAILGRTGSGKSTIAALLMRMYDVQSGEVLMDDKPISSYNLQDYRRQFGYVPQGVFLFSDTIARNIAFGLDNENQEKVERAAKAAAVYNNIIHFANGFQTEIGERGLTLSGGQKQRVSIARALITEPEVLIFDDSLSAVDTKTEEEILENLSEIMKNRTSILISHRVSTIKNADKIILLEAGRIVEKGTHQELISTKGKYFELYEKQKLDEEKIYS